MTGVQTCALPIFPEKGLDRISEKNTKFEITISKDATGTDMKYLFRVTISKVTKIEYKGFWTKIEVDNSRYISNIRVHDNSKYSSTEQESYYIDTDNEMSDTKDTQAKIFNLLMSNHLKREEELENEKINGYLSEIKKATDKSLVRDEKINDILN